MSIHMHVICVLEGVMKKLLDNWLMCCSWFLVHLFNRMAGMSFTIAVYVIRGLPLLNLMYHLHLSLLFPSAHKDFGHFYGELWSQVYLKGTL